MRKFFWGILLIITLLIQGVISPISVHAADGNLDVAHTYELIIDKEGTKAESYNIARKEGALFEINGPYDLFKNIYVDGVLVDSSDHIVKEASTFFTIVKDEVIESPKTGDSTNLAAYIIICAAALIIIILIIKRERK